MSHRKNKNKGYLKNNPVSADMAIITPTATVNMSFKEIWKKYGWMWLIVVMVTLAVYLNSIGNQFVSDDIGGIVQNPNINNFGSMFSSPLQALRFIHPTIQYVIHQIFGLSPEAYRMTNILFHLGTVTLVFLVILRLYDPITATITALIAGVHPIMTESITWISGGGHSLYTLFAWMAIFFLIISNNRNKYIALAIMACFISITISEKAIILPVVLLLFVWIYKIRRIKLIEIFLMLVPAVIIGIIFISKLSERSAWLKTSYYQTSETGNLFTQIPIAISSYLQLIVWPNMLTLYHSELSFTIVQFVFHVIVLLLYLSLTIFYFFKDRKIFFWLLLFIIGLIPTLTPFGVSWIVAERYVYFSAIGIFVIFGIFFNWLIGKNKGLGMVVVAIIIVTLSIRTIVRNMDWKNQDTLWVAMIRTSPSSPQNHNNLGDMYGRDGNLDQAVTEFKKAIELNPKYGDAYHNLGNTYQQLEKYDLALESYQKAISFNPNIWQSYVNIGAIYYQQNKYPEAEEAVKKAIGLMPQNDSLYSGLGVIYLDQQQLDKAKNNFDMALSINPNNEVAKAGLSKINEL